MEESREYDERFISVCGSACFHLLYVSSATDVLLLFTSPFHHLKSHYLCHGDSKLYIIKNGGCEYAQFQ